MKNNSRKHTIHGLIALLAIGISSNAGIISYVKVTGDADSGISSDNTYTHALDFGEAAGATINGVAFVGYNAADNGTENFSAAVSSGFIADNFPNGNHNVSGSLVNLMEDMYFNNSNGAGGTATWTLSGLTAGVTYDTRIYTRAYAGSAGTRNATLVFDPDGLGAISDSTGTISQDNAAGTPPGFANFNDAYYINYRFTAVAGQDLVITATQDDSNASWHLYGLSNQVVVPEPSTLAMLGLGTLIMLILRRKRIR